MLTEYDDLPVELLQESIGRRATGAAFGREEFHKDRRALKIGGFRKDHHAAGGETETAKHSTLPKIYP